MLSIGKPSPIQRDITSSLSGITCIALAGNSIINVNSEGVVTAVASSEDAILITNGDTTTEVKVNVSLDVPPPLVDSDADGLTGGQEAAIGTNPNDPDSDDDTLKDGAEVANGTNPLAADTDGDGIGDAADQCPLEPETVNGFQDDDGCY